MDLQNQIRKMCLFWLLLLFPDHPVNFFFQLRCEILLWYLPQDLSMLEENAAVIRSGNTDISAACLLHAVDRAAHDGYRDLRMNRIQILFDLFYNWQHIILNPAAGRTGNQIRLIVDQPETV